MDYVSIINIVFTAITALMGIYFFHFPLFGISGLLHKKKFPVADRQCRYGIVVSCKDEAKVIGRFIESIRNADYPQELLDVIVIAHNCTDDTAAIASSLGAKVIVDDNREENSVGQAYRYGFARIEDLDSYDGFFIFDADNVVAKDYFARMNDAFVYYECKNTITSFRHALNANEGFLPATYGFYWATGCLLAFSGRTNLGVSGRVTGCGFVMPTSRIKDGWPYVGITEDVEYSADSVLQGHQIRYCHAAEFYDEQPTTMGRSWHQRLRWAKGLIVASRLYWGKLFRALFDRKKTGKMSIYCSLTTHSFIFLSFFAIFLLQYLLLLFAPCAGVSLGEAFLRWDGAANFLENMFLRWNTGGLFFLARSIVFWFVGTYFMSLGTWIAARDKFKEDKKSTSLRGFLGLPFFLLLQLPLDLVALFSRNVSWVKIPHGE